MNPIKIVIPFAVWLVARALFQAVRNWRKSQITGEIGEKPSTAWASLVTIVTAIIFAWSLYFGARFFISGRELALIRWLVGCGLLAGAIDAVRIYLWPSPNEFRTRAFIGLLVGFLLSVAVWGFVVFLGSVPGSSHDAIRLVYPVKGAWRVVAGGRTGLTNYHHGNPVSQNYAVDLVLCGPEGASKGQPIYAPLTGVITKSIGNRPVGGDDADGNVIIIKAEDGTEVRMAHLEQGSVRVSEGDRVEAGQQIAACGDTGNADIAHLHIHAQRGANPVPMLFGSHRRFLVRNERFEN